MSSETKGKQIEIGPIQIRREIYQGDILSPLLFVIATISLTKKRSGFTVEEYDLLDFQLNIYTGDLKIIPPSQNKLKSSVGMSRL